MQTHLTYEKLNMYIMLRRFQKMLVIFQFSEQRINTTSDLEHDRKMNILCLFI